MVAAPYTIEFYEEDGGRSPVEDWMDSKLSDLELAALVSALEHVLAERGVNVCATEWGKPLGDGLFEFRVRHTAGEIERMFGPTAVDSGPKVARGQVLLRVFCHAYGNKIVLLLSGYDKGEDPSDKRQEREIRLARKRLTEFKHRQAITRKMGRRGHPRA